MRNQEIKKLIGKLEMIATTVEPGMVLTEAMCEVCSNILIQTISELKEVRNEIQN